MFSDFKPIKIEPIAYIQTDFDEKFGIPRQSGKVPQLMGRIIFLPKYRDPNALREIESFSHLWLLFHFSKSQRSDWSPTVRPPRLGGNKRVGVFASRSPFRPNSIGLSSVRLIKKEQTENNKTTLLVSGADLLNNTPILDIKPYLPYTDSHPQAVAGYADTHISHRLAVHARPDILDIIPKSKQEALISCLAEDPRPSYQNEPKRVYSMRFSGYDIHFKIDENDLEIIGIDQIIK